MQVYLKFLILISLITTAALQKDGLKTLEEASASSNEYSLVDDKLPETNVKPGQPCDLEAYTSLFQKKGVTSLNTNFLQKLLQSTYNSYNPDNSSTSIPYVDKIAEMCIIVDKDKSIDTFKFDCNPPNRKDTQKTNPKAGTCYCGSLYSLVDTNMPQPPKLPRAMREYLGVLRLNREFIVEKGVCVSGPEGHCTLHENRAKGGRETAMECSKGYNCVPEDILSNRVINKRTKEAYGVCLNKTEAVHQDAAFRSADGSSSSPKSPAPFLVLSTLSLFLLNLIFG